MKAKGARKSPSELMMLGSSHLISGFNVATGTFALMLFSAGVAAIVVAIVVRFALRGADRNGMAGVFGFVDWRWLA